MMRRPKIITVFILCILLVLLSGGGYFLFRYFNRTDAPEVAVLFPGKAVDGMDESGTEASDIMRLAVMNKTMRDGLVCDKLFLPYSSTERELVVSDRYLFADQTELLSFFAERNDKKAFRSLLARTEEVFRTQDGFYLSEYPASDTASVISISQNIRFCRVLLEGYYAFGSSDHYEMADDLQRKMLPLCEKYLVPPPDILISIPRDTPTPDFEATPTPKPVVSPEPGTDTIKEKLNATDISGIDLYALKLLTQMDGRWNAVYENSLDIVHRALLTEPGPFYSEAYYPDSAGYAAYISGEAFFSVSRQIRTALRLAETGRFPDEAYAFFKEELFNRRAFYQRYSVLTGAPAAGPESVAAYAFMARLARIKGDISVYEFCADRIFWNSADSYTSKIFGLTFAEYDNGDIISETADSILSLKALY